MKPRATLSAARPNASASTLRRGTSGPFLALTLATWLCGCGNLLDSPASAPLDAPPWEHVAFGTSDADFVGAIDLAAVRADPVFGPLVAQLARKDDLGVLMHASQIDVVASVDRGTAASWIAVLHGVDGAPRKGDVGSSSAGDIVMAPGAWILGEGPAFQRMRSSPGLALPRIVLPGRALVAATVQGRAIPRPRHPELVDVTEGLAEATMEVLGGAHLELVLRCRYVDAAAARHAATAARLVLVAEAGRTDAVSALARALVKLDFDARGDVVWVRVTISDDLRELLQNYVEHATE